MNFQLVAVVALGVLLFGLLSRRLQTSVLTPPMAFTVFGFTLGATGWVTLTAEDAPIEMLAELTLVLVLFTDATRIDLRVLRREYGLSLRLLGIGFPLAIGVGTVAGVLLLDGLDLWEAALLAAILAPTDAALGQAVVSSERVPVRVRQTLNVESGLNDGLALPFVLLFLSAAGMEDMGTDLPLWLRFVGLQLLLGPLVGIGVGYVGGELVDRAIRTGWMNHTFSQISALALSVLAFALAQVVGGNGFIAAFVAGLTLGNSKRDVCTRLYDFAEEEGQLLTLFVFLLFGAVMVGPALEDLSWRLLFYAVASLTLVRMIPVALSLIGVNLRADTVLFLAWFGPRGIASIIFGLLLFEHGIAQREALLHTIVLTVLLSTFLHGLSAAPLAELYGRRAESVADQPEIPELQSLTEMPLRIRGGE